MPKHSQSRPQREPVQRGVNKRSLAVLIAGIGLACAAAAWQAGGEANPAHAVASSSGSAPTIWLGSATAHANSSPTPTATPTSASFTGFPDASSTGVPAGTSLIAVPSQATSGTGWHWDGQHTVYVDAANVTISGLDINGALSNRYAGVTIKNTRVRCTSEQDWCFKLGGPNATVTDTEIGGGTNGTSYMHAIGLLSGGTNLNNIIQRVNVHHTVHGMRIDGGTTVVDSYIHDLPMGDPVLNNATGAYETGAHTDGIMSTGGNGNIIRHNRIECGNTSTMFVQWETDQPQISNFLIENNLFVNISKNTQVSSQGVAFENKGIANAPGITIRNNTFTKGWQVAAIEAPTGSNVTGNVFTDGTTASNYWV